LCRISSGFAWKTSLKGDAPSCGASSERASTARALRERHPAQVAAGEVRHVEQVIADALGVRRIEGVLQRV
jgi:hypothetical protein